MSCKFVMVSFFFAIMGLPSGGAAELRFEPLNPGVTTRLNAASATDGSRFLVFGSNFVLSSSLAGAGWQSNLVASTRLEIKGVAVGGGKIIVSTDTGEVLSSMSGTQWGSEGFPFGSGVVVPAVSFSAPLGRFVAVAEKTLKRFAWSTDQLDVWHLGESASTIGFEQWVSVTALGDEGFAAAGRGSAIKLSRDGGATWAFAPGAGFTDTPYNLRGICVGVGKIVAVGVQGRLAVALTNSGASFSIQPNGTSTSDLNAIAYSPDPSMGFIAVGSGGAILRSENGVEWTKLDSNTKEDLLSVAIATSGRLNGTLIVTGTKGTVLVGAPVPTASLTKNTDVTICNGETNVISATLGGSQGPWNVTWASNGVSFVTHSNVVSSTDELSVSPGNPNPNSPSSSIYTVVSVADPRTLFEGTVASYSYAATVDPIPTATVTGSTTICLGQTHSLSAVLTGLGPWNVTWASNGIVVAVHNSVADPLDTLIVSPGNPDLNKAAEHTYTVSALTALGEPACESMIQGSAKVTVNPLPSVTVSGSTTICRGASAIVQAALTGLGPWSVTWASNGIPVAVHDNVTAPSDTLVVTPGNDAPDNSAEHTYSVTALTALGEPACEALIQGKSTVTVNPIPSAKVTGSASICRGDSAVIRASLTGLGPWTVTWSSNGVDIMTNKVAKNFDELIVRPSLEKSKSATSHTYSVSRLATDSLVQCAPLLSDGAVVKVFPIPEAPISLGDRTNQPLGVVLEPGASASVDWYDSPVGGRLLATNTVYYTPTNNQPGAYTFYAQATSEAGCASRTAVSFTLVESLSAKFGPSAGSAIVEWFGPFYLEVATNVVNPTWVQIPLFPAPGTNQFLVNLASKDRQFFRLNNSATGQ